MTTNCNCISEIEAKVIEMRTDVERKPTSAKMREVGLFFNGGVKTISNVTVIIEGRRGKINVPIVHTFCPFCGKKYNS